jgi:hypothetical protein
VIQRGVTHAEAGSKEIGDAAAEPVRAVSAGHSQAADGLVTVQRVVTEAGRGPHGTCEPAAEADSHEKATVGADSLHCGARAAKKAGGGDPHEGAESAPARVGGREGPGLQQAEEGRLGQVLDLIGLMPLPADEGVDGYQYDAHSSARASRAASVDGSPARTTRLQ